MNCGKEFKVCPHETKKFCSLKCYSTSEMSRKVHSEKTKQAYFEGRKVYGGTTKWYSVETSNGTIRVQGTYEVRTCKILDRWKIEKKIKDWEYTNDRIEYVGLDNEIHNYLLDFKVLETNNSFYYIETKGYEKKEDKLKWEAVRIRNIKLKVWFEKEIINEEMKLI